jgi:RNA polymerase sigma-70 factor (ECF subfamily)
MSADESFEDVMTRLSAGDQAAAAEVFSRFARRLIALARLHLDGRLRQKVDPEDVLQSAFKSFFLRQAQGEFDLGGWDSIWALLSVITLRKCGRQSDLFSALSRDVGREATPLAGEQADASWQALARDPTPAEAAVLAETVELLLRDLKEREREIVSMALQGYTAAEISARLNRPRRTVYNLLERIKKRLRASSEDDS